MGGRRGVGRLNPRREAKIQGKSGDRERGKIEKIIVEVCRAFALTVSAKKTDAMCMASPRTPRTMVRVEAAGQTYKQVQSFTYLVGAVTETPDTMLDAHQTVSTCALRPAESSALPRDPNSKVEAIEAPLYGCST